MQGIQQFLLQLGPAADAEGIGQIARVSGAEDGFLAEIQRAAAGNGDHDHGGQDADVGQSRGVLLHPVNEPRDGNEIAGLIIQAAVAPQRAQHEHAASRHQQMGRQNHQNDCRPEKCQRHDGLADRNGQIVRRAQHGHAQQGHGHGKARFFLALFLAPEQIDRRGELHLKEVVQRGQQKNRAENKARQHQRAQGQRKLAASHEAERMQQRQENQPPEDGAARQAQQKGNPAEDAVFPENHARDMPPLHAQHAVEAELRLAPPDKKGVDIEHVAHGKQRHHHRAECKQPHGHVARGHVGDGTVEHQVQNDKEHAAHHGRSGAVGAVHPPAAREIADGQLGIKRLSQRPHLLRRAPKGWRQFCQRTRAARHCRDTSG